uniref:Uncharacterized protein n=1 Tax=Cyanoptyche gloeocystis TaxID=77922 RepID=A0A3G1IW70_9EUKA|nr:hypothetical protein [Cyanoptyche gloeocystis]
MYIHGLIPTGHPAFSNLFENISFLAFSYKKKNLFILFLLYTYIYSNKPFLAFSYKKNLASRPKKNGYSIGV